jgi:hypothetical protein
MAWSAPAIAASGAKSPPIASSAIRAKLGFPSCYSLLPVIVAAFAAHVVRTTHRLTARARLNDDGGGDLVRVAGALLPLGGSALRDGHGIELRRKVEPLVGLTADFPQRIPPAVSDRRAIALAGIQIGTTGRTEALAIFPALYEPRDGKQPLLPQSGAQVQLEIARVNDVDVRIVGAFGVSLHEQEVHVVRHGSRHIGQAPPAFGCHLTLEMAAEIVSVRSSGGEAADHVHRCGRTGVVLPPDRVVGRQITVDLDGFRDERTNVKGQHSRAIYRPGGALSSQPANDT